MSFLSVVFSHSSTLLKLPLRTPQGLPILHPPHTYATAPATLTVPPAPSLPCPPVAGTGLTRLTKSLSSVLSAAAD